MHPYLRQATAHAHVEDLKRSALRRRIAVDAAPARGALFAHRSVHRRRSRADVTSLARGRA
jgi:hypothetical protein